MLFSLVAADPQPIPASAAKPSALSPDKVICKQAVVTGSLINTSKICKTRREWDEQRENVRTLLSGSASCRNLGNSGSC
ncbi:hypothetical protein U1872_13225 [Sphingomonas sp. RB3P16]|uniref:hypothetical protein n=1 Tax=Parasphingomonas frigoris TaxID=3096163 RepID=UPI002FC98773